MVLLLPGILNDDNDEGAGIVCRYCSGMVNSDDTCVCTADRFIHIDGEI